jgi:hypothetical protein
MFAVRQEPELLMVDEVRDSSESEESEESEDSADVQESNEKTASGQSSTVQCRQRGESPHSRKVFLAKNQIFANTR